ncbi:MAG: phosphatidate cytidylyltransferase [Pirellulaceae bacterium]|nr:phosphatidate cytidylyltransferase [Pirellulaceae bacterium]
MLRWRLSLGAVLIAVVIGLGWLDHVTSLPGAWLMPVAVVVALLAGGEMLGLMRAGGLNPVGWTVHAGNLLVMLAAWLPALLWRVEGEMPAAWLDGPNGNGAGTVSWIATALAAGVLLAFLAEMRRFRRPGGITANLAGAVLAMVYVGLMLAFVVRMRLGWGVVAIASLIIVVKMGDTGAYTVGRLFGRHKLAPVLSPGKTIEGAAGAIVFATVGAWISFAWLVPAMAEGSAVSTATTGMATATSGIGWGWLVFGPLVGMAGLVGDLAESLLKRDAGRKDSSTWMPGFGGVLDILDSILLGAPAAYVLWASGIVGG